MQNLTIDTLAFITVNKTFNWKKHRFLRAMAKRLVRALSLADIRSLYTEATYRGLVPSEPAKDSHKRRYVWMAVKEVAFQAANSNRVAELQMADHSWVVNF